MIEKKIISSAEAAKILGVSRSRVSQLLKNGKIGMAETGIEYNKVVMYRETRKNGRPLGSYKK